MKLNNFLWDTWRFLTTQSHWLFGNRYNAYTPVIQSYFWCLLCRAQQPKRYQAKFWRITMTTPVPQVSNYSASTYCSLRRKKFKDRKSFQTIDCCRLLSNLCELTEYHPVIQHTIHRNFEQMLLWSIPGKQGRKAESIGQASPPKKMKLINDGLNFWQRHFFFLPGNFLWIVLCVFIGHCVFVGNLNNSKTFEEVTQSLEKYFMTQSLLVQDIRLAKSRSVYLFTWRNVTV